MPIFLPLTNLFHPAFEMISLEENNEDALIDLVTSAWVFKWGLNLHLLKEHITTTGTPQKSFKWMHSFTSNHSCHKSMRGIYYIEKTVIKGEVHPKIGTFFFSAAKNLFNDWSLVKMSKWSCTKKCMAKKHKQKERDNKQKQQVHSNLPANFTLNSLTSSIHCLAAQLFHDGSIDFRFSCSL